MVGLSHLIVEWWGTVSVMRTQSFHYHRLCSRPCHDEDENDPGSLENFQNLGNIENLENLGSLENLEILRILRVLKILRILKNLENLDADVGTIINMSICALSTEVKFD